jgi:hypothetical protein
MREPSLAGSLFSNWRTADARQGAGMLHPARRPKDASCRKISRQQEKSGPGCPAVDGDDREFTVVSFSGNALRR